MSSGSGSTKAFSRTVANSRRLSLAGAALWGVVMAEAMAARKRIGRATLPVQDSTGWYGRGRPGPALQIALLGDSSACGYGVDRIEHTPGAYLASGLAAQADRRVHMRQLCVIGARSSDLWAQVDRTLTTPTDVAVILVGANDVTHLESRRAAAKMLGDAVRRLRAAGVHVVVGTCPDLGTIRPMLPPLRQLARFLSRRLAKAQMIAVLEADGRAVSLGDVIGPEFYLNPAELFGPDRFHPSAEGYRACADVLLPAALDALGLGTPQDATSVPGTIRPLADAAAEAAEYPGTELDPVRVARRSWLRPRKGRLVEIHHRSPAQIPERAEVPQSEAEHDALGDS